MLAHLRVEIEQYPKRREEVVAETWPSGLESLYATREFVLRSNDTHLASATSAWLVFDIEARRPSRPPQRVYTIDPPDRPNALPHNWDDLPKPDREDHERQFEVRYHDLDVNGHANNLRILEWALETLPPDHLKNHRCTKLSLQFKAEATLTDRVQAIAQVEGNDAGIRVGHALEHADDERILALATTEWTSAP